MAHTCHAIGCRQTVPPEMFMCRSHWFSLSKPLQRRIWTTYRPGQCDDLHITHDYAQAAQACIRHIASKERRQVTGKEPELTLYDVLAGSEPEPPEAA